MSLRRSTMWISAGLADRTSGADSAVPTQRVVVPCVLGTSVWHLRIGILVAIVYRRKLAAGEAGGAAGVHWTEDPGGEAVPTGERYTVGVNAGAGETVHVTNIGFSLPFPVASVQLSPAEVEATRLIPLPFGTTETSVYPDAGSALPFHQVEVVDPADPADRNGWSGVSGWTMRGKVRLRDT